MFVEGLPMNCPYVFVSVIYDMLFAKFVTSMMAGPVGPTLFCSPASQSYIKVGGGGFTNYGNPNTLYMFSCKQQLGTMLQ